MKEIGGYLELDTYRHPMLHNKAVALNCGRNALAYLIEARQIKKICLPYFLCDSVKSICIKYNVAVRYYHIGWDFVPEDIILGKDEWVYLVNFYGQLSTKFVQELYRKYVRIIVDNAQDYFAEPLEGIDTLYTCRKYFGVADGAFLFTDVKLGRELEQDESYGRMEFVIGRYDRNAGEFYAQFVANNEMFCKEPIKWMSRLTANLLHGIEYGFVKKRRMENFLFLHQQLGFINELAIHNKDATFMYPMLLKNGAIIRKKLQENKIYVPMLWPNVLQDTDESSIEFQMANNILPLPIDQRYSTEDMAYITEVLLQCID